MILVYIYSEILIIKDTIISSYFTYFTIYLIINYSNSDWAVKYSRSLGYTSTAICGRCCCSSLSPHRWSSFPAWPGCTAAPVKFTRDLGCVLSVWSGYQSLVQFTWRVVVYRCRCGCRRVGSVWKIGEYQWFVRKVWDNNRLTGIHSIDITASAFGADEINRIRKWAFRRHRQFDGHNNSIDRQQAFIRHANLLKRVWTVICQGFYHNVGHLLPSS